MTRNVGFLFFALAAICGLIGMAWGIQMSATQDHSLSPAHGHLNLVGWVSFAIFGVFYKLVPKASEGMLAMVHFGLSAIAIVIFVPGIAMAVSGQGETLAKIGSVLVILTMLMFVYTVIRHREAF